MKTLKEFNDRYEVHFLVKYIDMYDSSEPFPVRNILSSLRDSFYRGLLESLVIWCNGNHLKPNTSKANGLVVEEQEAPGFKWAN